MEKVILKQLSFEAFDVFVKDLGWPKYRAQQVRDWIYQKRISRIDEMTNLSKSDRALLESRAVLGEIEPGLRQQSADGTQKFLFRLSDGQEIESVLIPEEDRNTLCISTQVGCTLDCTFCLTGTMGLVRNLKAHEIVDQVLWVQRDMESEVKQDLPERTTGRASLLTNVVLMGMGEPLANYREVTEALRRLTHPKMVGLAPRRITLSTSGLVPQIKKFGESGLNVNLAVSLNATTNAVRDRIMPVINRQFPLETLLRACRNYPLPPRRRIFFEYVLLKGVNDSEEDARRLLRLVKGIPCKVNLIPFNDYPGAPFSRPGEETVLRFQKILIEGGLTAFIRKSRGRDILAACGQLRTATEDRPTLIESVRS
ncbi:MAG: 23S rRNA (adenine(2503)-C(2))-methyltransferase RlmN [Nitrospirae bacterium]|nr:23S rRNA (adenine(2503)-C(2))-methyltransferase RlmN [Nitrospirota bacterium]